MGKGAQQGGTCEPALKGTRSPSGRQLGRSMANAGSRSAVRGRQHWAPLDPLVTGDARALALGKE